MDEKRVRVAATAGSGDGWGGNLPLRTDYPDRLVLDLSKLEYAVPTFLLRVRTFIDWHLRRGRDVQVVMPKAAKVNRHLQRMKIHKDLSPEIFDKMHSTKPEEQPAVLIPIARLSQVPEVDPFIDDLTPLIEQHLADVGLPPQPLLLAVSELAANSVEHGRNPAGTYVTAQRFVDRRHMTLAIADLGIGMPEHLRQQYPEWTDREALEGAARDAISGTDNENRGYGIPAVLEEMLQTPKIVQARLTMRSGMALHRITVVDGQVTRIAAEAPYKRGAWVTLDLGTA